MVHTCLTKNSVSKLDCLNSASKAVFTDAGVVPMMLFFLTKGLTKQAWYQVSLWVLLFDSGWGLVWYFV